MQNIMSGIPDGPLAVVRGPEDSTDRALAAQEAAWAAAAEQADNGIVDKPGPKPKDCII